MPKLQTLDVIFRNAVVDDALCIGLLGMQVFLDTYATEGIREAIAQEALDSFSPQIIKELIIKPDNLFCYCQDQWPPGRFCTYHNKNKPYAYP